MSDQRYPPEVLFEQGFTDLISVVPVGATISPKSGLLPSQLGKVPGRRNLNGTWGGYNWRKSDHTVDDVRQWMVDGANVGIKAGSFPGVDIDCLDTPLADYIEAFTLEHLGWAPVRYGRRPKRLLMYSTSEPFGRVRAWAIKGEDKHLVEFLGAGQQYLIHGIHPSGVPYEWTTDMRRVIPDALTPITKEQVFAFRDKLRDALEVMGYEVRFEGEGTTESNAGTDQAGLLAPSLDAIEEVFSVLPNNGEYDRDEWLKIGYAAKAAAGPENEHEVSAIFAAWSATWCGSPNSPQGTTEAAAAEEFRRCVPPYRIGWPYLAEQGREYGYNNAADDFEVLDALPAGEIEIAPPEEEEGRATKWTEIWLAEEVIRRHGERMRFVSEDGSWYYWTGKVWEKDARGKVYQCVSEVCKDIGTGLMGRSDKMDTLARKIQTNTVKNHVEALMRHAPSIALGLESFDADPWVLNTPEGIVNLRTAELLPPDPAALCAKSTAVAPDFGGPCPEWRRFLAEATGNDEELQSYLQRLAGYSLTGVTLEQQFTIFHGPGGHGKGTFKSAIEGVLGQYAGVADMATFIESSVPRHPTDIASLAGARLVTSTEVNKKQKLDAARLKQFSGEDRVKAHFMRQDDFTYMPQFKLILLMNLPPKLDADKAMRRRLHLVPWLTPPAHMDAKLGGKLKEEWPAILAWMIEGCLAWQKVAAATPTNKGLNPPKTVLDFTEDFFENEDYLGRWIKERLDDDEKGSIRVEELHLDFNSWASQHAVQTVRLAHHFSRDLRTTELTFGKNAKGQSVIRGKVLRPATQPAQDFEALL